MGVAAPHEVASGGGMSVTLPMSIKQAVEPFLAEHYAAEQQLKAERVDKALMGQFAANSVLLDEQFTVERQIAGEDTGFDEEDDFGSGFNFSSDEDEGMDEASRSGSVAVGTEAVATGNKGVASSGSAPPVIVISDDED